MKRKKRPMTILEIMIVIFIIGIVGSVVGYNMKGTMEQGKAFKTKEGISRLYEIFHYEMSTRDTPGLDIATSWEAVVKNSGFVKNPKKFVVDGWGQKYEVSFKKNDFRIESKAFAAYNKKKGLEPDLPWEDEKDSQ